MYKETVPWEVNYDANEIPPYTLPDILTCQDGTQVSSVEMWEKKRRPELFQLFKDVMYGEQLPMPDKVDYEVVSEKKDDLDGLALRREVRITFSMNNGRSHFVDLLLYIPNGVEKAPVFAGLTFMGNQVASEDKSLRVTGLNFDHSEEYRIKSETEMRGFQTRRFPLAEIMKRGYALALASYHDIFPDRENGWNESVYRLFFDEKELAEKRLSGYSSIGAWAWGLSRILDYLQTLPEIDAEKAAVYGHSRLGKSSLWAGVCDERFKLTCVNDSGCGGAALSRRLYGETLFSMYEKHGFGKFWFTDNLGAARALHPENLPIDQHELVSLIAPRSVSIHSASEDQWADPASEYLAGFHAGVVSKLYGNNDVLTGGTKPATGVAEGGKHISYFERDGKHDILLEDWNHYMDMADLLFK